MLQPRQAPRRKRGRASAEYCWECSTCGAESFAAKDSNTAREHAERFDHDVTLFITRAYTYRGRNA